MKQVIVMRKDLNMRKGKMTVQGSHACVGISLALKDSWAWEAPPNSGDWFHKWLTEFNQTKVCVSVDSEAELEEVAKKAELAGLPVYLVTDAGKTEFNGVPTKTCCAIGPAPSELIDPITGHLKLL